MMEDAARRAQKDKKAKKKKTKSSSSDSDASSDGSEELAKAVRKRSKTKDLSHLEKQLAQEQADEASLLRRIAEQQAKNEQKLQELAAARNNYPVCHVSPAIAKPASLPVEISTSDPFARLQKNTTVASINAILVPCLIAEFWNALC